MKKSSVDMRNVALKRLRNMLVYDVECSELGMALASDFESNLDDAAASRSLSDSFASKATGTLRKRSGSLFRYFTWALRNGIQSPFAASETDIYAYVSMLRDSASSATSASHFLEALNFLHSVVKLKHMIPSEVISARISGVSKTMYETKEPLKQKPQLTANAVRALERLHMKLESREQAICGQLLFCIHSSARWSDGQRVCKIELQVDDRQDLLVAEAITSKSTLTKESRTRLLPYVALGKGLTGERWGNEWLNARVAEGLDECDGQFMLPSWSFRTDSWGDVEMSAAEASFFLQDFLIRGGIPEGEALISLSQHEDTLTTWCSRSSVVVFKPMEQRLVGHHFKPKDKSPLTYSRQAYTKLYGKIMALFSFPRSKREPLTLISRKLDEWCLLQMTFERRGANSTRRLWSSSGMIRRLSVIQKTQAVRQHRRILQMPCPTLA